LSFAELLLFVRLRETQSLAALSRLGNARPKQQSGCSRR
jgi:hypothetical protein